MVYNNKNVIKVTLMMHTLYAYESTGFDPYENIATEKLLLESVTPGSCILYLWQNQNTVVIGRNQNAWAECRTQLLEEEGGKLARRLSGGGAVFHDLGNLNFTFLTDDDHFDVDKQLSVIQKALKSFGLDAVKSGRNDLLVEERKFSGNAFYHSHGNAYHHGTLLVNANMQKLSRYLTPPKAKLEAKGVSSVRSRVANLSEFCQDITIDRLKQEMTAAFSAVYGLPAQEISRGNPLFLSLPQVTEELKSWQWLYGPKLPFSFQCERHFPWGNIQLQLGVSSGVVDGVQVFTDAMDWTLPQQIQSALTGCRFDVPTISHALSSQLSSDVAKDLTTLLSDTLF